MMSANISVNVILPNGRRQNVKVTPNSTIFQILDEVCQKHGCQAENYDIKHFNKILDTDACFRFTNLPNNAQLEMVPCIKKREMLNVTIGLQLENGHRIMGEFQSNTVLIDILLKLVPTECSETAVIVFMHQEICGKELENTTLQSLGLSKGKAMLRLLHRDPSSKKEQAHVYVPGKNTIVKENENPLPSTSFTKFISNKILDPINSIKAELSNQKTNNDFCKDQGNVVPVTQNKCNQKTNSNCGKINTAEMKEKLKEMRDESKHSLPDVVFLGERNALVFNQAGAKPISQEELPDSFFDLTVEDAKVLLRDAKKSVNTLEESPLLTEVQRQIEGNKRKLDHINKYRWTIIRIQFPDQLVLQGLFSPEESVLAIKSFVRNYLVNPEEEFILYTAPPKHDLNPKCRLVDENLVPSSVIYYSGQSLLKPELRGQLTDSIVATIEAMKTRKLESDQFSRNDGNVEEANAINADRNDEAISIISVPRPSSRHELHQHKKQSPSWFKGLFK